MLFHLIGHLLRFGMQASTIPLAPSDQGLIAVGAKPVSYDISVPSLDLLVLVVPTDRSIARAITESTGATTMTAKKGI